jgi:BirA family transcriptional regulator, biotin operon repressor / biotin---[acetyl-CoA-carboxylase] ligase
VLPRHFADALTAASSRLGRLASRIVYLPTTGSTNDVASSLVPSGDHEGIVVVADAQTAGRGRRGHMWLSPPGSGLYVSVILAPARASNGERATALITLMAGVALVEGLQAATTMRVGLKWPNDLFMGGRKLGGVLSERVADAVVVGYGINVNATAFPPDLASRATSLETEAARPVARATVFAETLVALARRYDDLLASRFDAILDEWRARAPGARGARVACLTSSGTQIGVTDGIDARGALLVKINGRTERIAAGEVSWL